MILSKRVRVIVLDRDLLLELAGECYGQAEAEYRRLIGPFGASDGMPMVWFDSALRQWREVQGPGPSRSRRDSASGARLETAGLFGFAAQKALSAAFMIRGLPTIAPRWR